MENDLEQINYDMVLADNGEKFYLAKYNGVEYQYRETVDGKSFIFSKAPINQNSESYQQGFKTQISVDNLEDLFVCKMYAKYSGNIYEVGKIASELSEIELRAREDHLQDDFALGFKDNINMRTTSKFVLKEEIENLVFSKNSILSQKLTPNSEDKVL